MSCSGENTIPWEDNKLFIVIFLTSEIMQIDVIISEIMQTNDMLKAGQWALQERDGLYDCRWRMLLSYRPPDIPQ